MGSPSSSARIAYLRELAKVINADGRIEPDEMARLYLAFALLDASDIERVELLIELAFHSDDLASRPTPDELLQDGDLRLALAKDALFLQESQPDAATRNAVQALLEKIELRPEQTKVLTEWVAWENGLLRKLGAGEEWMADAHPKELASRAASVGIPVGVLYFAGITGFSAVGITSGLATIGGYTGLTLLGLNPMTAGIAGLVIAGVTAKKVADYALGNSNKHAKRLENQVEVIRDVHLRAALRLGKDLVTFEEKTARMGLNGPRGDQVSQAMHSAFAALEERAG